MESVPLDAPLLSGDMPGYHGRFPQRDRARSFRFGNAAGMTGVDGGLVRVVRPSSLKPVQIAPTASVEAERLVATSSCGESRVDPAHRNLEAAGQMRNAGVLLAVEERIADLNVEAITSAGCPHLGQAKRQRLCERFLGQVTWRELCRRTSIERASLPDTVGVA
jgi:hypothetical protein